MYHPGLRYVFFSFFKANDIELIRLGNHGLQTRGGSEKCQMLNLSRMKRLQHDNKDSHEQKKMNEPPLKFKDTHTKNT